MGWILWGIGAVSFWCLLFSYSALDTSFWHPFGGTLTQNLLGPIGAWVSAWIWQGSGLVGWFLPFLRFFNTLSWRFWCLLAALWSILGLLPWPLYFGGSEFYLGGFIGFSVSSLLTQALNPMGAWVLSFVALLVAVGFKRKEESEQEDTAEYALVDQKPVKTKKVTAKKKKVVSRQASSTSTWVLPETRLLTPVTKPQSAKMSHKDASAILQETLLEFGINGEVVAIAPGPVVTLFEFKPGPGIKLSRIAALSDDLSMALSAQSVRILAPIPGKSVVGIEIPNSKREKVHLRDLLDRPEFQEDTHALPIAMGKDIFGTPVFLDLAKMPHLLCAGQTGSGKSVFMNSLLCSLLFRCCPDQLRLLLIDPKFIEFRAYADLPHLLSPVVNDPDEAVRALDWAVQEMERRYQVMAHFRARSIQAFNEMLGASSAESLKEKLHTLPFKEAECLLQGGDTVRPFPFIVIVIDELADLMMLAKRDVERGVARLAQKARAAGIHLVIATQRPSTDVITGLIKANLPTRLSFQLASFVDSKTILDRGGAEKLLGQGDLLMTPPGRSNPVRMHACFLTDAEIDRVVLHWRSQGEPEMQIPFREIEA